MSKRIPVYLSEDELEELLVWESYTEGEGYDTDKNLLERLEAELATFEE